MHDIRLTLVGDFEDDFLIYQSNATHVTFRDYFKREILQRNQNIEISIIKPLRPEALRALFWSADCFAYPSFHEDENFGMAPREAMLCGLPFVVTDFCGLGELGTARGGLLNTFPTLGGIRYSLLELRLSLEKIARRNARKRDSDKLINANFVATECDPLQSERNLKLAAEKLLSVKPGAAPTGGWRSKTRVEHWAKIGPHSIKRAIELANDPVPEGLYVDGTGYTGTGWFSEPHFLSAIQSFYTSIPEMPNVVKSHCYRGFWRIALWTEEMALVEFGFPGPRIKRFNSSEWANISASSEIDENGEVVFYASTKKQIELLRNLVELGYLVPDKI